MAVLQDPNQTAPAKTKSLNTFPNCSRCFGHWHASRTLFLIAHTINLPPSTFSTTESKRTGQYLHDASKTIYGVTLMHTIYRFLTLVAITLVLSAVKPLSTKAQTTPPRKSPITQSTTFNPTTTQQVIEYFARMKDSTFVSGYTQLCPHQPISNQLITLLPGRHGWLNST